MSKAIYVKIGVSRWIVHCGRIDADGPSYGSLSQYKSHSSTAVYEPGRTICS